jgi:hypothetical protein
MVELVVEELVVEWVVGFGRGVGNRKGGEVGSGGKDKVNESVAGRDAERTDQ